jgi:hypothetical protein
VHLWYTADEKSLSMLSNLFQKKNYRKSSTSYQQVLKYDNNKWFCLQKCQELPYLQNIQEFLQANFKSVIETVISKNDNAASSVSFTDLNTYEFEYENF